MGMVRKRIFYLSIIILLITSLSVFLYLDYVKNKCPSYDKLKEASIIIEPHTDSSINELKSYFNNKSYSSFIEICINEDSTLSKDNCYSLAAFFYLNISACNLIHTKESKELCIQNTYVQYYKNSMCEPLADFERDTCNSLGAIAYGDISGCLNISNEKIRDNCFLRFIQEKNEDSVNPDIKPHLCNCLSEKNKPLCESLVFG